MINIGSLIAFMPSAQGAAYSGSKAYVLNFSRSLQDDLGPRGVKVQLVMPGPVRSEFFGKGAAPFPDELFMSAEDLVDSAMAALEAGALLFVPTLPDDAAWERCEAARAALLKEAMRTGVPAPRFAACSDQVK